MESIRRDEDSKPEMKDEELKILLPVDYLKAQRERLRKGEIDLMEYGVILRDVKQYLRNADIKRIEGMIKRGEW